MSDHQTGAPIQTPISIMAAGSMLNWNEIGVALHIAAII